LGNNLIGEIDTGADSTVWFDSRGGAARSTGYLIGLGHREICFLGDLSLPWYRRCHEGYCDAMNQAGLTPGVLQPAGPESGFEQGAELAERILKTAAHVTAIVAGDDELALGVLSVFNRQGVRVPDDFSLVGFDDIDDSKYLHPGLTTVRLPKDNLGEGLARLLFKKLNGDETESTLIPTELILRDSCASPRS